jgi:hypothetical protein
MEQSGIHQQINGGAAERGADHGAGQVPRGVLIFLHKVNRCVPTVVGDDYALQGQDQSQEKTVFRAWKISQGTDEAPEAAWGNDEAGDDQSDKSESFGQAGKFLRPAARPQADPI